MLTVEHDAVATKEPPPNLHPLLLATILTATSELPKQSAF